MATTLQPRFELTTYRLINALTDKGKQQPSIS
jgi:hypothetical protein